ncbi:MAG: single-stranded-DNA-specific exonuclease RecJ [Alphaproteobacteria bacterium]
MRINRKRWVAADPDPIAERRLTDELDVGPITARVLAGRGLLEPAAVKRFMQPRLADLIHPDEMCGAAEAARRIADAVERGESIAVHGDYDADGVTATALLVEFFRFLDHPVEPYIPERLEQGYGLAPESVQKLAANGNKLLITVDCGANDHEAVQAARDAGMDVIITDHHEIVTENPPAVAVLNPHQTECGFHGEPLAGVGIAFFLAAAARTELARRGNQKAEDFELKNVLDLVTLGTVADIVPLRSLNRILVYHGLPLMDANHRPGIVALKEAAKVRSPVRCGDISFRLAPRINAAGRLGAASVGVDLLLTDDPDEATRIAEKLNEENTARQAIEQRIFHQAKEMFEKIARHDRLRSIVLAHPDWHPGVVGIVASRMVEEYHRPTILICAGEEIGRGSGRSISAFNLFEALQQCEEHLEGFGGHAQAAGVQIEKDKIVPFAKALEEHARANLKPDDMIPRQRIDAWCDIEEISEKLVRELITLAPFGFGNPEPVLGARDVRVLSKQIVGNDHLKLRVSHRNSAMAVMAYGRAELLDHIGSRVDLAYSPEFNQYGGMEHIQLRVKDIFIPDA